MVANYFIGVHKQKTLFNNELLEESFDVPVTPCTSLGSRFQEFCYIFFLVITIDFKWFISNWLQKKEGGSYLPPCMFLVNWQSGQTPDCHLEGLIIQRKQSNDIAHRQRSPM